MELLKRPFSRRWILTTLLVIAGMAVLARLGIWQLDRLKQRRAFNARVMAQVNQPPLDLAGEALKLGLQDMEYRQVTVTGQFDASQQIALRGQYFGSQWGVDLVTPLHIAGTDQTVLVDRGWIPGPDYETGDWSRFDESGTVVVHGIIRDAQAKADFGSRSDPTPSPGAAPSKSWNFVNINNLSKQVPYPLLSVYIEESPNPSWTGLPYRQQPQLDLTEGPHLSYAIQWFSFAILLGGGYPLFIRRRERRSSEEASQNDGRVREIS